MTSLEEHNKKIREHLEEINDAINQGMEKKPVTIGFHCSACSIQYLELYLHLTKRIPVGKVVKHDWFKRPKPEQKKEALIERKLNVDFLRKEEIYELIYNLEDERTSLVYGKPSEIQVKNVIKEFFKLKEIFEELLKNEGYKI